MCFNETVSITPSKPVDEEEDPVDGDSRSLVVKTIPAIAHHSIMYAPKCLVLVSRLDYIETFRVSNVFDVHFVLSMISKNY
jgi:myotubularin-related protein 5/13